MAALVLLHVSLAATGSRNLSPAFDEVAHLTRAHVYWRTGDFRLAAPHPPLAHLFVGLPPFRPEATLPPEDDPAWQRSDVWGVGRAFFYRSGNDILALLRRGRLMVALLSGALALAAWWWSRRLFGAAGGLVTLALVAFEPSLLAHGGLVTTDTCVALFVLVAAGAAAHALREPSPGSVAASGLALGGAVLSKVSALGLIPVIVALAVLRVASREPLVVRSRTREWTARGPGRRALVVSGVLAAQAALLVLCLWAGYGFRYAAFAKDVPGQRLRGQTAEAAAEGSWNVLDGHASLARVIGPLRRHRLLPEAWLYGIAQGASSASGNASFLDGQHSQSGFRSFFPKAFLYKTPMAVFAALILALAAGLGLTVAREDLSVRDILAGLLRTAPLWLVIAAWWAMLVPLRMDIGHRHLLPTLAPMLVLAGASARWMRQPGLLRFAPPALCACAAIASMAVRPHYLGFFNAAVGGPTRGYTHLVDSSLDWGQELLGLRDWLARHVHGEHVALAYWGNADPAYFGVLAEDLPHLSDSVAGDSRPVPGLFCVSATAFQQLYTLRTSRWTDDLESEYRALQAEMLAFEAEPLGAAPSRGSLARERGAAFARRFDRFQRLRFGRLCAWLRPRPPEHEIGFAILIWRLDEDELRRALDEERPT